jgi:diguanylate cyclase (GGDEF)-like protein/PAS domain S-box-containing protein
MPLDTTVILLVLAGLLATGLLGALLGRRRGRFRAGAIDDGHLAPVLEVIGEGVIHTDAEGRVTSMNPVAVRLTGWTLERALGRPLEEVFRISDEQGRVVPDPVTACLRTLSPVYCQGEHSLRRHDGQVLAVTHTSLPIRGPDGRLRGAVLAFRDVSVLRSMARQLRYQASHDPLTGLLNRTEFESRLEEAMEETRREPERRHALCYLDLDQFKVVNDSGGHADGDRMLKQLARLLHSSLREHDVLARLGGDEFGILLRDCAPLHAEDVADSLRRTVREFRFVWQDRTFDVSVSIGLAPLDPDSGTVANLLSAADAACQVAKEQGRNRVQVYHPDDAMLARHRREMHWVQQVSRAVERDRLVLFGQPVVALAPAAGAAPYHLEVLVRMLGEGGELEQPLVFIPAAERFDIMSSVDRWVVRKTLALMADWKQQPGRLYCAINLSGQSLCDPTFLPYVLEQLRHHDIPPANVGFEITETAAIANFDQAQRFLTEIRALGSRFALDDFGSGLSSFGYLKNLPVDFLKIDGSFVRDMVEDPVDHAMVESINQMGHVMGMQTIAEYVETEATLDSLRRLGVDYAQGHAVGGVRPLEELLGALPGGKS